MTTPKTQPQYITIYRRCGEGDRERVIERDYKIADRFTNYLVSKVLNHKSKLPVTNQLYVQSDFSSMLLLQLHAYKLGTGSRSRI